MCSEAMAGRKEGEGVPATFSVFDALRDTIYSEVATLIANNENRPHFLVSENSLAPFPPQAILALCVGGAVSGVADAEY